MNVKIVRIDPGLPLPEYKTTGAAAFDLYSRTDAVIAPRATAILPSNLIIEAPRGHALIISARSGLHKRGLMLANGIGVIDPDYHGPKDEIGIAVYNFTDEPVAVARGDRIAQGFIIPVAKAEWEEVAAIKENSRGGFGSTG